MIVDAQRHLELAEVDGNLIFNEVEGFRTVLGILPIIGEGYEEDHRAKVKKVHYRELLKKTLGVELSNDLLHHLFHIGQEDMG